MVKLDATVYFINDDYFAEESTLRELIDRFAETTTTPQGVAPKYHLRGNEVWTWGHGGNTPEMISEHDSEEEAQEALEQIRYEDFEWCDVMWFYSQDEAEEFAAKKRLGSE